MVAFNVPRYVVVDGSPVEPLVGREDFIVNENGTLVDEGPIPWYDTKAAYIAKWAIFTGLFLGFFLFLILGKFHARKRLRSGKIPWKIHAWLLTREERATYDPRFRNPEVNYVQGSSAYQYPLQQYPPPTYAPGSNPTSFYTPPDGATKTDPSQWRTEPTRRPSSSSGDPAPEYSPPPGPPPATAQRPMNTGASEASNNPYRL